VDTSAIPHAPRRLPLLGDAVGINPRAPLQSVLPRLRDLGPISVLKGLGREFVVVGGAELVADLNDETRFGKHVGVTLRSLRRIFGDALFTADTDEANWRLAHDVVAPAFSRDAMRGYHTIMVAVARELLARWDAAADRGHPVDVTADMGRLTLETIGRAGFGYQFGSFHRERPHPFVVALTRPVRYNLSGFLPCAPVRRADVAIMEGIADDIIQTRRDGAVSEAPNLLDRMLRTVHPETGRRLDPVNVRRQVMAFVMAGHETASGALSFALYYLTRDAQALARVQAEVDSLWGEIVDVEPTFTDIPKLRYVRAALDEALRLWPTAPGYLRVARTDTMLAGRYRMNQGDWAIVLLPLLHRDPLVWPDPDRFDPGRFAPSQVKERPAHAYKPFGTGQRACIGRQFALHEAVLTLGLVLHRYELTTDDNYQLRVDESFTFKPRGFRLTPRRRRRP
jgi:cytochrome P450